MNKDYYKILGIEKSATDDDIRKGYRKMAMKFHPDKNDSPDASERFKEVAEAYEVLIDRGKRSAYDQSFSNISGGEGGGDSRNYFQYSSYSFTGDPVKIFNHFFGNEYNNNNPSTFPFSQQFFLNREDIGANNFFEKNSGSNQSGSFTRIWRHSQWEPSFEQSSSANSQQQQHPSNLHRTSYQTQTQRQQQQHKPYSTFPEGRKKNPPITRNVFVTLSDILSGRTIDKNVTCKVSSEDGHVTERIKSFTIDVKRGCANGTKITFREMGDEFPPECIPSDVIFVIKETPHLHFKRINSDLIYTARISLKTALCGGGVIGVPTLEGPSVPLYLDAEVINPKTEKRIMSRGLPCTEQPLMRGNLIIKFDIQFPLALSDASRKELLRIL